MEKQAVPTLSFVRRGASWYTRHPFFEVICLALLLTLVVEMLSRHSMGAGIRYMLDYPLLFALNAVIVLATFSVSLLLRHRGFVLVLISTFWLALGLTNCILLCFRSTPLAAIDFLLVESVFTIVKIYLAPFQFVLIGLFLLAVLGFLFLAWRKMPLRDVAYVRSFSKVTVIMLVFAGFLFFASNAEGIADGFENLPEAYADFGFIYCFSTSVLDRGIDEPDNYAKETVQAVLGEFISSENVPPHTLPAIEEAVVTPNIIMLQLESFFDPETLTELDFSADPVPVFSALKENCGSAFLTVPCFGAGTANTEFEILSGMSLDYFGTGEYPYKTILQNNVCESICYDLKELGYYCRAIHNHEGTFYDRNLVFSHLGFDGFTSLEYMQNVETNPLGWAKDEVLTAEILKALDATEAQDFIYTISVQAHGQYPSKVEEEFEDVAVLGLENTEDEVAFSYYLSQLQESDAFLGELIAALSEYDEPVLLVAYGDHLPRFDIEADELANGSILQTEYVIWSNYGQEVEYQDLSAYQLTAYVMEQLGFDNGVLTKFHQSCREEENYQEQLELLQYDMLYGDQTVYGGLCPHTPTALKMGTDEIAISEVYYRNDAFYVYGAGFTPWSVICLDGKPQETEYLNATLLCVRDTEEVEEVEVSVAQIGDDREILSETKPHHYRKKP